MNTNDVENHLSDFRFDRLLAGELDGTAEAASSRSHLEGCPACSKRYDMLAGQAGRFAEEAFRRRLAERVLRRMRKSQRRWWSGWAGAAVACGVLLLWKVPGGSHGDGSDLRAKGSLELEVVARRSGGAVESLLPNALVSPGDAVRFQVSAPISGYIAVASIDGAGTVNLYAPATASRLAPIGRGKTLLAGAIELDQVLGRERLVALLCPEPLESKNVIAALGAAVRAARGDAAAFDVEKAGLGCAHSSVWLEKVASR